ncbi:hypothetical protein OG984_03215 [Nocardioides sp. NBC_00368]|uniref:hypothetical protein n=1 Tax=Nocardioides sp. NBC_00368 TaxID=2976000 RepID=UPI002E240E10
MTLDLLTQAPAVSDPAGAAKREIDRRNAPLRTEIQLVRGRAGIESAIDALRRANPGVDIRVRFA